MKAYKLLADPAHWTQRAIARNRTGDEVDSGSHAAVAWCLTGALHRSCFRQHGSHRNKVLAYWSGRLRIYEHLGGLTALAQWNDAPERTHADVVRVLRELDL